MRSPGSHHEGPQRQAALSQQSLFYHTVGLSYGLGKKNQGKEKTQLSSFAKKKNSAGLSSENPRKKAVAEMGGRA